MVSTQVFLTEEEQRALQALARRTGRTESELIRDAVDALLSQSRHADRRSLLHQARGLWENRDDIPDFSAMRREMDRAPDAA